MTRRRVLYCSAAAIGFLAIAVACWHSAVRSGWLEKRTREWLQNQITARTGSPASVGSISFRLGTLEAEVRDLVIRGSEPADAPLLSVASVRADLGVRSLFARDFTLDGLFVERPHIRIRVSPNGETNLPLHPSGTGAPWPEQLIALSVGRFELREGTIEYGSGRIPLDVSGEQARMDVRFDPGIPGYKGSFSVRGVQLSAAKVAPVDLDTEFLFESKLVTISRADLVSGENKLSANGTIANLASPHATLNIQAQLALPTLQGILNLPGTVRGGVALRGVLGAGLHVAPSFSGEVNATNVAWHGGGVRVPPLSMNANVKADASLVELTGVRAHAFGGGFTGSLKVREQRSLTLEGTLSNLSAASLIEAGSGREPPWDGLVSGTVKVAAERMGTTLVVKDASSRLRVAAVPGRIPLQGDIDVAYDGGEKTIRLGTSQLETEASRLQVSGILGSYLNVSLNTSNLEDLLPVASLVRSDVPATLPLKLTQGGATFQGAVAGALAEPRIEGRVRTHAFTFGGHTFDGAVADVSLRRGELTLSSIAVKGVDQTLEGDIRLTLRDFTPTEQGSVSGNLRLTAGLDRIAPQNHALCPCSGRITASATVEGAAGAPGFLITLDARNIALRDENADRIRASVKVVPGIVDVSSAVVEHAAGTARLSGRYEFEPAAPEMGMLRFQAATKDLDLSRIRYLRTAGYTVRGLAQASGSGEIMLTQDGFRIRTLNATTSIPDLTWENRAPVGVQASARTAEGLLHADAAILIGGATATATAAWRMDSKMDGEGTVRFASLPLPALLDLVGQTVTPKTPGVQGALSGSLTFRGPLRQLDGWRGSLGLDEVEVRVPQPRTPKTEYVIRNDGAINIALDAKAARVVDARFKGTNTNISIRGAIPFAGGPSLQLDGDGTLDLALLRGINPDVLAGGTARAEVGLRGSPKNPQVTGRLTLNNASLSVEGVPNSLDGVNGLILFSRQRATIADKLTGQTGGGRVALTGFIGVDGGDFIYRLQAEATGVRVRYPEGVSTTLSGNLALTGTSARSILTGTVNVQRSGFDQQVDVGGMLARKDPRQPEFAITNAFLRGMDLDLRVRAASGSQFHTPITGDLAMEANLQVRGTVPRPVVLGRVTATQGEIDFFGTRYEINSCEIAFLSAARLEPVLNMNLSTQVRGITVNVNFSGTLERLNITYRSDPPLSSQEIIALLTVGRTPTGRLESSTSSNIQGDSMQQVPAGSIIGQALMAPLSSRLNRFFGISRVKIDPRVVGFYDTPQAYLTIEQQVSKDVTASFSTNLSNSQQQLVRVEWNLNRKWSLVGVREHSTGAYTVEVLFRKIF